MKAKYKYLRNIDSFGLLVGYLTIGSVYEFEMEDENYGKTYNNNGKAVFEFFPDPAHGQWEKVE